MEKTIAIIASLDTKEAEVEFLKGMIEQLGCKTFIIDVGAKDSESIVPHIRAEDVARAAGREWNGYSVPKHEMILGLMDGIAALMPELYAGGNFDAVLSIGGAQNTVIGVSAMKALPVGLPKLMVSTIACGQRTFESFVGTKDIVLMPSIADISGVNNLTRTILSNAAAAIVGMAEHAGIPFKSGQQKLIIGATLMGVINTGVAEAVKLVEKAGFQVISFHSTGVGGRAMEEFIQEGTIGAVMDLSLHEITSEMFGKGFSTGAYDRLTAACNAGIPQVIAPGGVDFIDFYVNELPKDLSTRKYVYHNSNIVHVKLMEHEIVKVGEIIAERLNKSRGPVTVLIPLRGLRQNTSPGEALYSPEVDNAFIEVLHRGLRREIKIVDVDANINDRIFSKAAAAELLGMLEQYELK